MTPTGNWRLRAHKRWFSTPQLVAEAEFSYVHVENIGGRIETETRTIWRDAKFEDLLEGVNAQ